MARIPDVLRNYARDAAGAFRLAPVEVLLGLTVAVAFSVAVRADDEETFARIAASAALALFPVFGLSVLRARGVVGDGARWGATALVLLVAAAYGAWVVDPDRETEAWRFVALLGGIVLAVSLVPTLGVRDPEERRREFWRFNALLVARIVSVVAYGAALYAALAGAVAAVSSLFELTTPAHLYQDLLAAVFFGLVPWVVVGGIPELVAPAPADDGRAPRAVRLLGRYLYAPVLAVYLAILIAYTGKVLATGELPKNLLSPIILLAGLFGFLGSLLLEPLRRDPEHTGVARLVRVFPAILLVLLPLAVRAVWVRREQYGWTEFRYLRFALLLALAVLAAMGVYRLLRRREPLLRAVPVVLAATLLLSAVGPWSASAVSRRNQEGRLRRELTAAGLMRDGRLVRPLRAAGLPGDSAERAGDPQVPRERYDRITGAATYLYSSHGRETLERALGTELDRFPDGWSVAAAFPLRPGCEPDQELQTVTASLANGAPVPGLAGGTLYRVERSGRREPPDPATGQPVQLQVADSTLLVHVLAGERWTARVDLRAVMRRMAARGEGGCGPGYAYGASGLSAAEALHPLVDAAGRPRGQVVLTTLGIQRHSPDPRSTGGPFRLEHASALVLVQS